MTPDASDLRAHLESARLAVGPLRQRPEVGIVLGSGLAALADELVGAHRVPYADIPHMPGASVPGHRGELLLGRLGSTFVACLSGRAHLYEGHEPSDVVFGVRLLAELGISKAILTNAAGGISGACQPGTLMLITDHLNLTGKNPLVGPGIEPRFVDMSQAYDLDLRIAAKAIARRQGLSLAEGVYAGLLGPNFETPAEIHMLETLGVSAVGMSTVLETIALRQLQVSVLGISCITNRAAGKGLGLLSHEEVGEVAGRASSAFCRLVSELCASLSSPG